MQPLKDVPTTTTSISSTPINVVTTSTAALTPIPVVLPLQSNTRKPTSSHPIVDLKLNLKPLVTAAEPEVEPKTTSSNVRSSLSSGFTQQEESILLSQKKGSRLRLPNDFLESSSNAKPGLSLYPMRRLDELETLTEKIQITSISVPTTSSSSTAAATATPTVVKSEPKVTSQPATKTVPSDVRSTGLPILTRDRYYIKPTMDELKSLCNKDGECIVHQVTIGHEDYGSVTFYGWINLSGWISTRSVRDRWAFVSIIFLFISVTIRRQEVIVYSDDEHKPPMGEGLNRSARINLFGVYPVDRATREEITDLGRIKAMNYEEYLKQITSKFDGGICWLRRQRWAVGHSW